MTAPATTVVDHLYRLAELTGEVLHWLLGDDQRELTSKAIDDIIDSQMAFAKEDGDLAQVRRLTAARDFYDAAADVCALSEDGPSAELAAAVARAEQAVSVITGRHLALVEAQP